MAVKPEKFDSPLQEAGWPIWHNLYNVKVRHRDTMSDDYIRIFGAPAVGDPATDHRIQNEWISLYITINDMVEYRKRDVTVLIVNHEDSKHIYEVVHAYLGEWKTQLQNSVNVGGARKIIEDLLMLDKFAAEVYPHAVIHFPNDYIESTFMQTLAELAGGRNWLERFRPKAVEEGEPVKTYEERGGFHDFFTNRVFGG